MRGFIGDAVLAFFSPGFASENYPAEAIEAARELVASAQDDGLAVGAGVHRGTCFAGLTASEMGRLDLDAKGDTVNVAARLASAASAGHVLVSEAAGAANPVAKEQYLKGREEPVRVFDLDVVDSTRDRGVLSHG